MATKWKDLKHKATPEQMKRARADLNREIALAMKPKKRETP